MCVCVCVYNAVAVLPGDCINYFIIWCGLAVTFLS